MKSLMPQIDSNDGLFHNGNPATGEQGTRVTDTWLNNLQDRVRDVQAEAHYVLQKAGFTPKAETQTQLYQAIVKIIDDNRKTASLTQKGETKLYTGYDSQSEDLASTPKTAYQLKQLIDSNTRALGNVIPNSKKSSAVNSNSEDTVANSKAAKIAYDKGVEAKTAADNAQRTANDGVSKADAAQRTANDGVSKADAAQRTANDGVSKATAAQTSANQAKSAADTAQRTASDANNNANTRQLKSELIGEVAFFARTTPPNGWLKANGAAVSRTTYAALFSAIGTTFGAGDGRTTFNLPDLRGEFIRCLDDGRNVDRDRRLGTAQGDAIRNITGKLDSSAMGSGNQVLEGKMIASGAIGTTYQQRQWSGDQGGWGEQSVSFDFDASRVVPTANENRPRNVALLACIKY
ncbi:phage tail protein [Haemophilus haemolyticus]|uniref:Phage tail fiber protein n=1 Tax=Haemophilus haemolyticus TaxID=726 RepID=A0AAQ1YLD3_HAEHA|nr:phage tail protein [Haemophilus haemolyticus]TDN42147.1 Phage tail fiber protein [Haemophilus haemolyticus]